MLNTLNDKIDAMITEWTARRQEANNTANTYDGAIQAANLIKAEIVFLQVQEPEQILAVEGEVLGTEGEVADKTPEV